MKTEDLRRETSKLHSYGERLKILALCNIADSLERIERHLAPQNVVIEQDFRVTSNLPLNQE